MQKCITDMLEKSTTSGWHEDEITQLAKLSEETNVFNEVVSDNQDDAKSLKDQITDLSNTRDLEVIPMVYYQISDL